jgi:RimJ/RimL family protein N-acetyltransferase
MDYRNSISSMKRSTFSEALQLSIVIFDKSKNAIGKLVPVGDWILDNNDKIELIRSWRQRTMRMFLTQFESTYEKTFGYLKNLSIAQEGRIFFLIYDADNRCIGHIGIADVDGNRGELDNLMRGVEGGDPRLVYFSEISLLDWCFKFLGIIECDVQVLSYNWLVISLHEEVGFSPKEKISLRKNIKNGVISHETATESDSNVSYACIRMLLSKEVFYRDNGWLA